MRRKTVSKLKILLLLGIVCAACLTFAACDNTYRPEENGYSVLVTYDANGGRFGTSDRMGLKTFKYKPNTGIIQPGGEQTAQFVAPLLAEHHVIDWYPAVLDDAGNVQRDEGDNIITAETPWNFATDKLPDTAGFKLYLVARWAHNFSLTIDVGEEARAAGVENVVNRNYDRPGPISRPGEDPSWDGHTFYGYYSGDKRLVTESDWRAITVTEENPDVVVTARWLEGLWTIVTAADQLPSIMASTNYYIDADIDFGGRAITQANNYYGEFNGNGHMLSNFRVDVRQGGTQNDVGLFGRMGVTSKVHDVLFEGVTINVTLTSNPTGEPPAFNVGFLSGNGTALDMANFTNIGFVGCRLEITRTLLAVGKTVNTGSGTHRGIFGILGAEQTFVPVADRADVTVTLDGEPVA